MHKAWTNHKFYGKFFYVIPIYIPKLDISKIFWLLWYFTPVHKWMPKPNLSSKDIQKMDWKHGYLAQSYYILVRAVLGRADGWKLMLLC